MQWFDKASGEEAWMVCRNGHLWRAVMPHFYDFEHEGDRTGLMKRAGKVRLRAVRRCSLCAIMKEAGQPHLRGITKVHPDWLGVIKDAKQLANGTIEHHHPEQVAQAYSEEHVKEWASLQALISIQQRMGRRGRG